MMKVRRSMRSMIGLVLVAAAYPVYGAGDFDSDGHVTLADYAELIACVSGPGGMMGLGCHVFDVDGDSDVDFADFAGFQRVFGDYVGVSIETVLVGNPGNAHDTYGYGGVDYVYDIGKYEVTAREYCVFLNAVAADDTYHLYNSAMASDETGCLIVRAGAPGGYSYNVAPEWADRPVNFVSWGDAIRFANWLHNGQPIGAQDLTTTEDGSYFVNGVTGDSQLLDITREPDATWAVPSENEWYKAAYHMNDGVTGNYYFYPMSIHLGPSNDLVDPDPGRNATYYVNVGDYTIGAPYYRTEGGAHENSGSPYGTFDQGGNVLEWNEVVIDGFSRGVRGGSWFWGSVLLQASDRPYEYYSPDEFNDVGFRVVRIPPSRGS